MGALRTAGNVFWFLTGAPVAALLWVFYGVLFAISIAGLPWARACFSIAKFTLLPFGRDVVSVKTLRGKQTIIGGFGRLLGNAIWFPFCGLPLASAHLICAFICFVLCILIITIPLFLPLAYVHLKLAGVSVWPVGRRVVSSELAKAARLRSAEEELDSWRRPHFRTAAPDRTGIIASGAEKVETPYRSQPEWQEIGMDASGFHVYRLVS